MNDSKGSETLIEKRNVKTFKTGFEPVVLAYSPVFGNVL
jgi:hypothetical protein